MPVYMIRAGETGPVKLGHSADPAHRLVELQVAHYERLRIIRLFEGGEAEEASLHIRFSDLCILGEWHSFSRLMMGDVGLVEIADAPAQTEPPPSSIIDVSFTAGEIGARMKALRRSAGLTQGEVAPQLGLARSSLASIEAGHDLPGRDVLLRASEFFGVPLIGVAA